MVLAATAGTRLLAAQTFEGDPGKGFLAVQLESGAQVIGTHVTFGKPGEAQLQQLANLGRAAPCPTVIAGDFNAEVDAVRAGLASGYALADLAGLRCTRTATPKTAAHTIDHVAVPRGAVEAAEVQDGGGLSDHHPVVATLGLG